MSSSVCTSSPISQFTSISSPLPDITQAQREDSFDWVAWRAGQEVPAPSSNDPNNVNRASGSVVASDVISRSPVSRK